MRGVSISYMHVISLAVSAMSTNNNEVPIQVTRGAFWRHLPQVVMYQSSVPLVYERSWPKVKAFELYKNFSLQACLETRANDTLCEMTKWFETVQERLHREIETSMEAMSGSESTWTEARSKRELNFIGDMLSWCCGVATSSDFREIFVDEAILRQHVQALNDFVQEDHGLLTGALMQVDSFSVDVEQAFQSMKDRLIENQIALVKTSNRSVDVSTWAWAALHGTIINANRIYQLMYMMKRNSALDYCRNSQIPPSIIPLNTLAEDLASLRSKLNLDGYDLSIGVDESSFYYKLSIADCEFSNNTILVKLKIPIVRLNQTWSLYEFLSVPFSWQDKTCLISHEPTFLAVDSRGAVMTVTGTALKECDAYGTRLCYLPPYPRETGSSSECPGRMYQGAGTVEELSRHCHFECHPANRTLVTQIDTSTYVVVHSRSPTVVECRGQPPRVVQIRHGQPGALQVQLPCDCQLTMAGTVHIARTYPCANSTEDSAHFAHILPAAWTNLETLEQSALSQQSQNTFSDLSEFLNYNWSMKVPHFMNMPRLPRNESQIKYPNLRDIAMQSDHKFDQQFFMIWNAMLTLAVVWLVFRSS